MDPGLSTRQGSSGAGLDQEARELAARLVRTLRRGAAAAGALWLIAGAVAACTEFTPQVQDVVVDANAPRPCSQDQDCVDDSRPSCKVPTCDNLVGVCTYPTRADQCFVDGICYPALGTPNDDRCRICQPSTSQDLLQQVACTGGATCDPATGRCEGGAEVTDSDACLADTCGEDRCGALGCCETSDDCDPLPGACSDSSCQDGVCREAGRAGDCLRTLNSLSACASAVAPAEVTPPTWVIEQPDSEPAGWRFETEPNRARFEQDEPNSGRTAFLIGPIFSISPSCSDDSRLIQVEHRGQLTVAFPHLAVRAEHDTEWVDLGALPSHGKDVPRVTTIALPATFEATRFQVAFVSNLSALPPTGFMAVHRVRVATGQAPEWQDAPETITVSTGQRRSIFVHAVDGDGDPISYFLDPATRPPFVTVESPATNDDGLVGVRLVLEPERQGHVGRWPIAIDARDAQAGQGRVARLFVDIDVESASECGNVVLDPDEECDLGVNPVALLCSANCEAPELGVPQVTALDQTEAALAAFGDGTDRLVVGWASASASGRRDLFLRLVDAGAATAADVFDSDARKINADTLGDHHGPRLAVLSASSVAAAWQRDFDPNDGSGTVSNVFVRIFDGRGDARSADRLPYVNDAAIDRTEIDVAALAADRVGLVWREAFDDGGGGEGTRIEAAVFSLADIFDILQRPPTFTVATDAALSVSSPRVLRRPLADPDLLILWLSHDPRTGAGGTRRLRFAGFAADGTPTLPAGFADGDLTGSDGRFDAIPLDSGGFLAVWEHTDAGGGSGVNIRARIFDALGAGLGPSVVINDTIEGRQLWPRVAANGVGEVFMLWHGEAPPNGFDVIGRLGPGPFDDTPGFLREVFGERHVNDTLARDQTRPALAGLPDGRFAMAWQSDAQDGSGAGVFVRFARLQGLDP